MHAPTIELIPLRPAVCSDAPVTLDVLVRIIPPALPEVHFLRAPINLALVLDHSGSMAGGRKIDYAREAAIFAVEQLLPTDRVSVTIFDDNVTTVVPSTLATDKPHLVAAIRRIAPGGSTALHAGWKAGAEQVLGHLVNNGLNRVLLLSDGLANVGVSDPNIIAAEAKAVAGGGVSTTTLGLGDDYNEDLMEAMAQAGDGNYYFIESPRQLADIFQTELQGLMALTGQKVSLGAEPTQGARVADVLNDFAKNEFGRSLLPNLVAGMPLSVVVRLNVPATSGGQVCQFRLAWDRPGVEGRQVLWVALELPAVPAARWHDLDVDAAVQEQVALLMAARARREAVAAARPERPRRDGLVHATGVGLCPTISSIAHDDGGDDADRGSFKPNWPRGRTRRSASGASRRVTSAGRASRLRE